MTVLQKNVTPKNEMKKIKTPTDHVFLFSISKLTVSFSRN